MNKNDLKKIVIKMLKERGCKKEEINNIVEENLDSLSDDVNECIYDIINRTLDDLNIF